MGWLDTDKDLLRTMWARGESSRDIASALIRSATRNAVMGMVDRLGLMGLGHADAGRLESIDKVSDLMQERFSLGSPLHREALLALTVVRTGSRSADVLAKHSGVSRAECAAFLERLDIVWERGPAPARWQGGLEGNIAFILDMAVVAGMLSESPVRGRSSSRPIARVTRRAWSGLEAHPAT